MSPHGTTTEYRKGCRCPECRRTASEASLARRKRNGYKSTKHSIKSKAKAQEQTLDKASNHRKLWTGPDYELALGRENGRWKYTYREAALLLGRSAAAVSAMRTIYVKEQRNGQ